METAARSGTPRRTAGWVLAGALALWGLGAVGGGYGLVGAPDGSGIGLDPVVLDGTPFGDFLLPGALLLSLGLGSLLAACVLARLLRRQAPTPQWVVPGLALVALGINAWILGEIAVLWGSVRGLPVAERRFYYAFWGVYTPFSLLIGWLVARFTSPAHSWHGPDSGVAPGADPDD